MPRSVLRLVAIILGLCAVGGFILGVRGAPERARLPGEAGQAGAPLQASDAQPLDDFVLTPSELPPEVKKEDEKPEEKAEPTAPVEKAPEAPKPAPPAKAPATPPGDEDRVGDLIDGLTPQPEQPPY